LLAPKYVNNCEAIIYHPKATIGIKTRSVRTAVTQLARHCKQEWNVYIRSTRGVRAGESAHGSYDSVTGAVPQARATVEKWIGGVILE